jgi:uncharacterized protein YgbK (DUF1537 family)
MAEGRPPSALDALQCGDAAADPAREALAWLRRARARAGARVRDVDAREVRAAQQRFAPSARAPWWRPAWPRVADGLARLGVAAAGGGGRETSGAVVQALGIRLLRIGPTIAPGVPWRGRSSRPAVGTQVRHFGAPGFFVQPCSPPAAD